jgi:hypothetical protein
MSVSSITLLINGRVLGHFMIDVASRGEREPKNYRMLVGRSSRVRLYVDTYNDLPIKK